MTFDPNKHYRRSIRLKGWDYTKPGAYFITWCVQNRVNLLGTVIDGEMRLNDSGNIVREELLKTPQIRPAVEIDEFAIMPDHVHAIIVIFDEEGNERATQRVAQTKTGMGEGTSMAREKEIIELIAKINREMEEGIWKKSYQHPTGPKSNSIGAIMGQIKSVTAKRINALLGISGKIWHRDFYEHIIRDGYEHYKIKTYIQNNALNWKIKN